MTERTPHPEDEACNALYQDAAAKQREGKLDEAAQMYGFALTKGWAIDYALADLGGISMKQGELDRAERLLMAALDVNPRLVSAMANMAAVHRLRGDQQSAIRWSDAVLEIDPGHAQGHNNKGSAYFAMHNYESARAEFEQAVAADPTSIEFVANLAAALSSLGRYQESVTWFERARELNPRNANCNYNFGKLLMKLGYFEPGLKLYEWRWGCVMLGMQRHTDLPLWRGETSPAGMTILVHQEQGLGDGIQFCRFVSELAARGARVIFETYEPLLPILENMRQYATIIPKNAALPAGIDAQCPLMSLPLALGLTMQTIPPSRVCISVPDRKHEVWREVIGSPERTRIGVVWTGRQEYWLDAERSISLQHFDLGDTSGFEMVSLQKEVRPEDRDELDRRRYRHFGPQLDDFGDTAALVDSVDLVISVDTSVAHLAASLGKPVWLLLPANSDWRWFVGRADSPWYPTVKLFRQQRHGEWEPVLSKVRAELAGYKHQQLACTGTHDKQ